MIEFRQSAIAALADCPRKFFLRYKDGWERTEEDGPASKTGLGTLVHAWLEARVAGERFEWPDPVSIEDDEVRNAFVLARIMCDGYEDWVRDEGIDAGYDVLGVEEKVYVTFPDLDARVSCTLDFIRRDCVTGAVDVIDYKTVQDFRLADTINMNFQLLTYALAWKMSRGETPASARLRMLRKVKRTARAKPPFYAEEAAYWSEARLKQHWHTMRVLVKRAIDLTEPDAVPHVTGDCTWKCEFRSGCLSGMFDDPNGGGKAWLNATFVKPCYSEGEEGSS